MPLITFVLNFSYLGLSFWLVMWQLIVVVYNYTYFSFDAVTLLVWPQKGIWSVQNHISRCVYTGIRLEDVEINSRHHDSASAVTMPLFQTQPMEPESCRRDVSFSSQESTASDIHAAGIVSAFLTTVVNISSSNNQQAANGSHCAAKTLSFTSSGADKQNAAD